MHCTCALGNKNFHSGHYCRIMSTVITYIFCQYHTVVLFMSPQFLLQYLMQDLKLATQFRHALGICMKEVKFD